MDSPEKYSLCGITFDGNGDLDLSSGKWSGPTEVSRGIYAHSATFDWDTVVNGGAFLTGQNIGNLFQYSVTLQSCFRESFVVNVLNKHDRRRRQLHPHPDGLSPITVDRDLYLRFPLTIQFNATKSLNVSFGAYGNLEK